jgi:hypothetical protein
VKVSLRRGCSGAAEGAGGGGGGGFWAAARPALKLVMQSVRAARRKVARIECSMD